MIHDAIVPVTCDKCRKEIFIHLPFISDGTVDIFGVNLHVGDEYCWRVIDGKHYCCETCASEAEND